MIRKESFYAMSSVFFKLLSGPLAILLITTKLTVSEQGVYYMFLSLSAIQWVFELGISTCMIQYISASNNDSERARYIFFLSWFLFISSVILFFSLLLISHWALSSVSYDLWLFPWVFYLLTVCFNLYFNILLVIDEGLGNLENAYYARMLSGMAYTITLMICLFLNLSLYSLSIAQLIMLFFVILYGRNQLQWISIKINSDKISVLKKTMKEVLSFQYKLSIVWIAGYFYWNSFQILLFKYVSPELGGAFGATNSIFGSFAMIAISLVSTQRSTWGKLNSLHGAASTYYLFRREAIKGIGIYIVLSLCFIMTFYFLPDSMLKQRFLPFYIMVLFFLLRCFITHQEFVLVYLRTFKDEPLYKVTIINYILLPMAVFCGILLNNLHYLFVFTLLLQITFSFIYQKKMKNYIKI